MTDRPILFSAPMVRALIAGTKTQTRRVMSRSNCTVLGERWGRNDPWDGLRFAEATVRGNNPWTGSEDPHLAVPFCHPDDEPTPSEECGVYRVRPVIEAGDHLWVRETWAKVGDNDDDIHACPDLRIHAYYRTDVGAPEELRWRPSIFMPRWASRLTLIVEAVKVERLQDISEEDARAEGCIPDDSRLNPNYIGPARSIFEALWDRINGTGSWDANPWVAAYTFRVERRNIGEVAE